MTRQRLRPEEELQPTYIREWREYRNKTQDALIALLPEGALSKASLSRIENGKQFYTQDVLQMIARALDVTPATLLQRSPYEGEDIWEIWAQAKPDQRKRIIRVAKTLLDADAEQ